MITSKSNQKKIPSIAQAIIQLVNPKGIIAPLQVFIFNILFNSYIIITNQNLK